MKVTDETRIRLSALQRDATCTPTQTALAENNPGHLIERRPGALRDYLEAVRGLRREGTATQDALAAAEARMASLEQSTERPLPGSVEFDRMAAEVRTRRERIPALKEYLADIQSLLPNFDVEQRSREDAIRTWPELHATAARNAVQAIRDAIYRDDRCLHTATRICENIDHVENLKRIALEFTGVELPLASLDFDETPWRAVMQRREPRFVSAPESTSAATAGGGADNGTKSRRGFVDRVRSAVGA